MKISKPIFEHSCHKCGCVDEARFTLSGPHLKQICNECGFYVKFFDKTKVPDVKEIKLKIFYITEGDLSVIEKAKTEIEFVSGLTGLYEKLQYWKLYLHIRKLC